MGFTSNLDYRRVLPRWFRPNPTGRGWLRKNLRCLVEIRPSVLLLHPIERCRCFPSWRRRENWQIFLGSNSLTLEIVIEGSISQDRIRIIDIDWPELRSYLLKLLLFWVRTWIIRKLTLHTQSSAASSQISQIYINSGLKSLINVFLSFSLVSLHTIFFFVLWSSGLQL